MKKFIAYIITISLLCQNVALADSGCLAPFHGKDHAKDLVREVKAATAGADGNTALRKDDKYNSYSRAYSVIADALMPLITRYHLSRKELDRIFQHLFYFRTCDEKLFLGFEDEFALAGIILYFLVELDKANSLFFGIIKDSLHTGRPAEDNIEEMINVLQSKLPSACGIAVDRFGNRLKLCFGRFNGDSDKISIGDISISASSPKRLEYVPKTGKNPRDLTEEELANLRWMMQKDQLGQDIFLIGPPGREKRALAMYFAELTRREVEYIALTKDTSEFDLKQRREKRSGTTVFFDEAAVRAAIYGRILVLDNVQYAERNVLPTLNNLLENREINLEDGRRIISAARYDELLKTQTNEELTGLGIIRAHPCFRVIAIGCPPGIGNPLDPPFRSRFQGREIKNPENLNMVLRVYAPNVKPSIIDNLIAFSAITQRLAEDPMLKGKISALSVSGLIRIVTLINEFPETPIEAAVSRAYPIYGDHEGIFIKSLDDLGLRTQMSSRSAVRAVREVFSSETVRRKGNEMTVELDGKKFTKPITQGSMLVPMIDIAETENINSCFHDMAKDYFLGRDMLLIGGKGEGKTVQALYFVQKLGLEAEVIPLYKDITVRNLLQRRITASNGDTGWQNMPLIETAIHGRIAILDGIDQLDPKILSALHRLIQDREIDLPDGTRLVNPAKYQYLLKFMSEEELKDKKIFPVNPDFRIIALGKKPSKENKWLTSEIIGLFSLHTLRYPSSESLNKILLHTGTPQKAIYKLQELVRLMNKKDISIKLSLRQLVHIGRHLARFGEGSIMDALKKATLIEFLTKEDILKLEGIIRQAKFDLTAARPEKEVTIAKREIDGRKYLEMDELKCELTEPQNPAMVPDPSPFYDIPEHKKHLKNMFKDYLLQEDILLIGMQGTGKNKIADRFTQLLNREREYMQLHRDTTVDELTSRQALKEGILVWEDSPLVKAAVSGHILLLDEVDKAPVEVVHILKNFVEYRELLLPDGRRLIPYKQYSELRKQFSEEDLRQRGLFAVHPDFRIIMLANRPGFPFLGNDFYREMGDLLSVHVIDNPPEASELDMLKKYAPDVPDEVLIRLIIAFNALRESFKLGDIPYPYSTREIVAVVKHMQRFPDDPIDEVLKGVFSFDEAAGDAARMEFLLHPFVAQGLIDSVKERSLELKLAERKPMPQSEIKKWALDKEESVRFYPGGIMPREYKPLRVEEGIFILKDERIKRFGEQVLSWETVSEGYVDLKVLPDGRIATITKRSGKWFITVWDMKRRAYKAVSFSEQSLGITRMILLPNNKVLLNLNGLSLLDLDNLTIANVELSGINTTNQNIIMYQDKNNPHRVAFSFTPKSSYSSYGRMYNLVIGDFNTEEYKYEQFSEQSQFHQICFADDGTMFYVSGTNLYLLQRGDKWEGRKKKLIPPAGEVYGEHDLWYLDQFDREVSYKSRNSDFLLDFIIPEGIGAADVSVRYQPFSESVWRGIRPNTNIKVVCHSCDKGLFALDSNDNTCRRINIEKEDGEKFEQGGEFSAIDRLSDGRIITIEKSGKIRVWDLDEDRIKADLEKEKQRAEARKKRLVLKIGKGKSVGPSEKRIFDGMPKEGKAPDGAPHIGGSNFRGGTGGRETAGLGGIGGPWREMGPKGQGVVLRPDADEVELSPEAKAKQRELAEAHLAEELRKLEAPGEGREEYYKHMGSVIREIKEMRNILENLDFKGKETVWRRGTTEGELDDSRLGDGLAGARNIHMRRTTIEKRQTISEKKKRLYFAVDVSASMFRYNHQDKRLERAKELVVMIMEAFAGYEDKYDYAIVGHCGTNPTVPLVDFGHPPSLDERFKVIRKMGLTASNTESGDNTVSAARIAVERVFSPDADDCYVFLVSDANLKRYNIDPGRLGRILTGKEGVNGYAVFIASFGDEAERIVSAMPSGRAQVALNTSSLPKIFKGFLTRDVLKGGNISCGTVCESGHEGSRNALDEQLKRQFEELKRIAKVSGRDLIEREADKALVKYARKFGINIARRQLSLFRRQIRENAQVPKEINIFFSIPENPSPVLRTSSPLRGEGGVREYTELFWVGGNYAGGHFNGAGTRIHISLPIVLKQGIEAGIAIAKHDLAHIQGKGHLDDEGMRIVREIAEAEKCRAIAVFSKPNWIKVKDDKLEFMSDDYGSNTVVRRVLYKGNIYWAKYERRSKEVPEQITPQAEILCYLNALGVQGIPNAKYFLETEEGMKIILFEELPKGTTLTRKIIKQNIDKKDILTIILKIAHIVKQLHSAEICHWDITTSNIWIADNGDVILFDFDLAFRTTDSGEFVRRRLYLCNPSYFSSKDRRSSLDRLYKKATKGFPYFDDEVYSLGMVFMLILTGSFYWFRDDRVADRMLDDIKINMPETSPEIMRILSKAVSNGKSEYKTVDEFIKDLEQCMEGISKEGGNGEIDKARELEKAV